MHYCLEVIILEMAPVVIIENKQVLHGNFMQWATLFLVSFAGKNSSFVSAKHFLAVYCCGTAACLW